MSFCGSTTVMRCIVKMTTMNNFDSEQFQPKEKHQRTLVHFCLCNKKKVNIKVIITFLGWVWNEVRMRSSIIYMLCWVCVFVCIFCDWLRCQFIIKSNQSRSFLIELEAIINETSFSWHRVPRYPGAHLKRRRKQNNLVKLQLKWTWNEKMKWKFELKCENDWWK